MPKSDRKLAFDLLAGKSPENGLLLMLSHPSSSKILAVLPAEGRRDGSLPSLSLSLAMFKVKKVMIERNQAGKILLLCISAFL
jgi:hypothetical protein